MLILEKESNLVRFFTKRLFKSETEGFFNCLWSNRFSYLFVKRLCHCNCNLLSETDLDLL